MINISNKIYAAWSPSLKYDLPEAEVGPYGESAAEKKRQQKISTRHKILNQYDNIPLPGFTLYSTDRKHYGATDATWLVIDPRGFLVRISGHNLKLILTITGITEGLVQEKCVWVRDDSQTTMQLIPVTSPLYVKAVENTELIESKVDIKTVQIGDRVLLQNGLEGKFMGSMSLYGPMIFDRTSDIIQPITHLRRQVIEITPGKFHIQTNAKILKVIETTTSPMSRVESLAYINGLMDNRAAQFTSGTHFGTYSPYNGYGRFTYASAHAESGVGVTLEEIQIDEATELFEQNLQLNDAAIFVVESAPGKKFIVLFPWNESKISKVSFPIFEIRSVGELGIAVTAGVKDTLSSYTKSPKPRFELSNFTKFYKIVKHIRTETY